MTTMKMMKIKSIAIKLDVDMAGRKIAEEMQRVDKTGALGLAVVIALSLGIGWLATEAFQEARAWSASTGRAIG
jgi:hypothetical protein